VEQSTPHPTGADARALEGSPAEAASRDGASEVPALLTWALDHDLPGAGEGIGGAQPEATEWTPTFPMPVDRHQRSPRWWTLAVTALVAAIATVGLLALFGLLGRGSTAGDSPEIVSVREVVTPSDGTTSVAAVGRKVTPSVVTVMVGDETAGTEFSQFGLGSGVVLDAGGLVVTNAHVIEGSDATRIVLQDGTAFDSTVVGVDERTDLAVLRVDGAVFEAIEIGSTGNLEIGDVAIAVGNPLGLAGGASLTAGVVSAFEREVATPDAPTLFGMLQTDAPITRGSSGGALVDVEGRLIGITTAIGVSSGVAEGIGFAIPVELVSRIADEIITSGEVHHAFLGVRLDTYREDRGDGGLTPSGAVVTSFPDDVLSAAAAAGIREGDVIVTFEGDTVTA
jgi:S1-C subfamily serine protease